MLMMLCFDCIQLRRFCCVTETSSAAAVLRAAAAVEHLSSMHAQRKSFLRLRVLQQGLLATVRVAQLDLVRDVQTASQVCVRAAQKPVVLYSIISGHYKTE